MYMTTYVCTHTHTERWSRTSSGVIRVAPPPSPIVRFDKKFPKPGKYNYHFALSLALTLSFPFSLFLSVSLFFYGVYPKIFRNSVLRYICIGTNIAGRDYHSEYYKILGFSPSFSLSLSFSYRRRERNVASDLAILESDLKDCAGSQEGAGRNFIRNHIVHRVFPQRAHCTKKKAFCSL